MSGFKFDPSQPGLRKTLREWEELALRHVWSVDEEGAHSGSILHAVNEQLGSGKSISRASIITFMNRMVDQGVLGYKDATKKGGHYKIYYPLMDEKGFVKHLAVTLIESLMDDFPEETTESLVYLDVWERDITEVNNHSILEPDLTGRDQVYDPSKLGNYIEESLERGLRWVVFEPNDEPLWPKIRLTVRAFMHSLFRQGAFQGTKPSEAYLVKCDRETTTQEDIDNGIVNIVVGFAPIKPAEFVIINIQQITGNKSM